jgi:hypothetical protein
LAEIKHQGKSKLQHPEPLAHRKLLHATLHWENRWAATAVTSTTTTTSSKPAWETFSRPNRWAPRVTQYSPQPPPG